MNLPKVPGTQIRGTTYHFNLPIPSAIQAQYPTFPAGILRGTLRTSDAKEAERQVREQRAIFDRQVKEARRLNDRDRILGALGQEDRDLLAEIGGPDKLLSTIRDLRRQSAFILAGRGAETDLAREMTAATPQALRLGRMIEDQEAHASLAVLNAETRRLKSIAVNMGENVPQPPIGVDEGGEGLASLAESFIRAKSYTVQNADSLRYTVRRWTEFYGDQPLAKLTRAHLAEFDDAARDLPVAREWLKKPMRAAVAAAKKGNLDRVSYKVRERLITHLKALSAFALDKGALPVDPWAGYRIDKPKEKVADRKAQKVAGFTPAEVKAILAHVARTAHADTADYWLPMLSAYSGARREELGQLRVEDVRTGGNIPALRITDEGEDQKVKNAHSLRTIPVPPVCIERGFLDFVARRRRASGTMLFLEEYTDKRHQKTLREMTPDPRGRLTEVYGGRFSRKVLAPLGIKTKGQGFHALRHSWTDAARRAKIDPEIRRLIAGRLDGEDATEAGYGGGDLLADKLEALIQVAAYVEE